MLAELLNGLLLCVVILLCSAAGWVIGGWIWEGK